MPDRNHYLTAAGGWCAPAPFLREQEVDNIGITLPEVRAPRGGITFPEPCLNDGAFRREVHKAVARLRHVQDAVLEVAAIEALDSGWDIHVHRPSHPSKPMYPYIGIELTPRVFSIPTIYEHRCSARDDAYVWDEDEW